MRKYRPWVMRMLVVLLALASLAFGVWGGTTLAVVSDEPAVDAHVKSFRRVIVEPIDSILTEPPTPELLIEEGHWRRRRPRHPRPPAPVVAPAAERSTWDEAEEELARQHADDVMPPTPEPDQTWTIEPTW